MKKRGLSTIVSTLLILLLVFVAIGILWVVVRNVVQGGSEQISLGKFTLDMKIDQVQISESLNQVSVKVKRNSGEGEFVAMKFIFSDGENTEIFNENSSLKVNEKKTYTFDLVDINVSNLESVSVAPIFLLSSGKESIGDIKDSWEKGSDRITPIEEENNVGAECTVDSNCTADYNSTNYYCSSDNTKVYTIFHNLSCGSLGTCEDSASEILIQVCNSTQNCSNGNCVNNPVTPTCTTQNYTQCSDGNVYWYNSCNVKEGIFDTCLSTETCLGNQCVVSQPPTNNDNFTIIFSQNFEDDTLGDYLFSEFLEDWKVSSDQWIDPCYRECSTNWDSYINAEILYENNNKFLRNIIYERGGGAGTGQFSFNKPIGSYDELYFSYKFRLNGDIARICSVSGECVVGDAVAYHGKLPGLCGGSSATNSDCPGGGYPTETGFSMRYMFHGIEEVFFYLYLPDMPPGPGSYGQPLTFNSYENNVGNWHTITQRIVIDTSGQNNGIIEGFLDGVLVAQKTGINFNEIPLDTLIFANFLGGSGENPLDYDREVIFDFDNFVLYKYKENVMGVPKGNTPSPAGRILQLPIA